MNARKPQTSKLYPFIKDQQYGFMDAGGRIVLKPQYSNAREFSDGLAFVTYPDGKKGYIDESGQLIISGTFLIPGAFSEGYAAVVIRPYEDDEAPNITDTPGPYIYIDRQGNNVFGKEFLYAGNFHESFAEVYTKDGYKTYINTSGKQMTSQDFTSISKFIDGYASVSLYDENSPLTIPCILDTDFNLQKFEGFNQVQVTNDGYAVARKGSKFGVLDVKGNVVIDFQYDYLSGYEEQLFIFRKGERQGYIDINNNLVLSGGSFSKLDKFENGFAIAAAKGAKYGVINKNGEFIIPPEFKQINSFGDGLYRCVTQEDTETFYNTSGEEIIPH